MSSDLYYLNDKGTTNLEKDKVTVNKLCDSEVSRIKKAVLQAKECDDFCKRCIFWMIKRSLNFTAPVYLLFPKDIYELGKRTGFGIHDIKSDNCKTRLDDWVESFGSTFRFGSSCSSIDKGGWSVWLNKGYHPPLDIRISIDLGILAEIFETDLSI